MARQPFKAPLAADRPISCLACKRKLPANTYTLLDSGYRRKKCPDCTTGRVPHKRCRKCGIVKSKDDDFLITPSGRRRDQCNACTRPARPTEFFCPGCKVVVPKDRFGRQKGGQRKRLCLGCNRVRATDRVCRTCGNRHPLTDFPIFRTGNRSRRCTFCRDERLANSSAVPVRSANPCLNCGEYFYMRLPKARRDARKYCGEACERAAVRRPEIECSLCVRKLPYENFDFKKDNRGKRAYCRECGLQKQEGRFGRSGDRLSVLAMVRYLKQSAKARRQPVRLSAQQAADASERPCELCGDRMHCLYPRDRAVPYDKDSVAPVCVPCRSLADKLTYWGLVDLACRIADGPAAGRLQQRRANDGPAPERAAKRAPKRRKTDSWLHPETPICQPFRESFEDKVHRQVQARAERHAARHVYLQSKAGQSRRKGPDEAKG